MGKQHMEYLSVSYEQTMDIAAALAGRLRAGDVIAFSGGLGAGKTAFTAGFARGLGIDARVTSPTFAIVNEYEGGRLPLFHFDMYRLSGADELFDIGWEDYLRAGGVCAVEWSENVAGALPEDAVRVRIEHVGGDTRRIIVENLREEGEAYADTGV